MTNLSQPRTAETNDPQGAKFPVTATDTRHQSRAGYFFDENEPTWTLDKNNVVYVSKIRKQLNGLILDGFIATLSHYARTMSAAHTRSIFDRAWAMLREMNSHDFSTVTLINYRATLNRETEWYLGTIRGFLYKWYDLGYPGIDHNVVDLLESWTLMGNIKGDAIKRLDPTQGPLTDNELMAFNEGTVRAFEQDQISITQLALALLLSNTGRRPIQLSHTKICDLAEAKNNKGEQMYLIQIPRAKQQGEIFRESFKTFAMTIELWSILDAQRKHSIASIEQVLGHQLQKADQLTLPLFPDLKAFIGIGPVTKLREVLATDYLHMSASTVTTTLQKVVSKSAIISERTGEPLEVGATRFRYTKGTRAAREGFGIMVIAELLDHSDTQNADVYIKGVPEHAQAMDRAMAFQMARHAQAFQGTVVDREDDAIRGNDPASRIKYRNKNAATCGKYGPCGANAPIACFTCGPAFQPWLDGPHEELLADLLAEREEIIQETGDETIAAALDRTIFAVINVINRCEARRNELATMNKKGRE